MEKAVGAIRFLSSLSLPFGERSSDNADHQQSQLTESAVPKAKPAGMSLLLSFAMVTYLMRYP